jgi:hypothetical protein
MIMAVAMEERERGKVGYIKAKTINSGTLKNKERIIYIYRSVDRTI